MALDSWNWAGTDPGESTLTGTDEGKDEGNEVGNEEGTVEEAPDSPCKIYDIVGVWGNEGGSVNIWVSAPGAWASGAG